MCSVLLKVFDKIVIRLHSNSLSTSDMHYGFTKKHSTTQCTMVLEEIIQYYKIRNSSVCLDSSKSFDMINYENLFHLLIDKGLHMFLVKPLVFMYTHQLLSVKWGKLLKNRVFYV